MKTETDLSVLTLILVGRINIQLKFSQKTPIYSQQHIPGKVAISTQAGEGFYFCAV